MKSGPVRGAPEALSSAGGVESGKRQKATPSSSRSAGGDGVISFPGPAGPVLSGGRRIGPGVVRPGEQIVCAGVIQLRQPDEHLCGNVSFARFIVGVADL